MKVARLWIAAIVFAAVAGRAEPIEVPDSETAQPPTPARIAAILGVARRDGWPSVVPALQHAAVRAYARDNLFVADAWYDVCAWSTLFAAQEGSIISQWIDAVNGAQVGHANMPRDYPRRNVPLGAALSPELQAWVMGNRAFSEEFFALLSPVDCLPRVFDILQTLYRSDPAKFRAYPELALAIAVVYDVPPPTHWPHQQVTPGALPRRLLAPEEAFAWWTLQDRQGRLYHSPKRLGAEQLKFVVDVAAPVTELDWAQQQVVVPMTDLPRAYTMIRYRMDRVTSDQPIWPGRTYRLADILATGGICADQAYFACTVAKAHGVPSLLFSGAGNDVRHAWFGYLDENQHWQLDAGRYTEERFVTGFAIDPQTWGVISDHELQFLAEGFRRLPSYRQSHIHEEFASILLAMGSPKAAAVAARKAVNFEPRNQPAWDLLITATRGLQNGPIPVEVVMREAALAFHGYPDLEAHYAASVVESLWARGQTSEADEEVRRIARQNQGKRDDISIRGARAIIERALATQPLAGQLHTYDAVLDSFGRGAGIAFFDLVVRPFVEHLRIAQHGTEAQRALDHARRQLQPPQRSQLAQEMDKLQRAVAGTATKPK
jgi:hypothetical protein